jgi:hypothetical protein
LLIKANEYVLRPVVPRAGANSAWRSSAVRNVFSLLPTIVAASAMPQVRRTFFELGATAASRTFSRKSLVRAEHSNNVTPRLIVILITKNNKNDRLHYCMSKLLFSMFELQETV